MADTALYVDILRDSLVRKKGYLSEVLELAVSQGKLAKSDDFDETAFEELIDRKEVLIGNINEIDKGFTSVYDRVRTELLENKDSYRDVLMEIQRLIRECVDIGMKIEAEEERNRHSLEQVFSTKFKGIRQLKQSKSVANKYYKSMANGMVNDSMLYDTKK